ncbi:MAG: hypothetical protein ACKVU4_06480 [Phycisphaerales bacterium]
MGTGAHGDPHDPDARDSSADDPLGETKAELDAVDDDAPPPPRVPSRAPPRDWPGDSSRPRSEGPLGGLERGGALRDQLDEDRAAADDDEVEDVDLDSVYDRLGGKDDASLKRFDPEAGRTSITIKLRAVRQSLSTPFGRLVMTFPVALAAITVTIFAVNRPEWPLLTAAGVLVPASLVLVYIRYQQWLGHKRYLYRLLETLGEDVSDFDPMRVDRRVKVKRLRRRKR